jgi:hypothetical protein
MRILLFHVLVFCAVLFPPITRGADTNAPPASAIASHPILKKILWYLPNRLFDLADIVRLRVRVGPGLALNARATKWAVFYSGEYHTAYAGLPGPRLAPRYPAVAGLEQEKGLALLAVDATDTMPHEPYYSNSEFTLGAQALIVGAEAGFDPVEVVDLLLGFVFLDIRRDDH